MGIIFNIFICRNINLLRNFPASFAYSFLLDIFNKKIKDENGHRSAMKTIMFYNLVGMFCIFISMIYKLMQNNKKEEDKSINVIETNYS